MRAIHFQLLRRSHLQRPFYYRQEAVCPQKSVYFQNTGPSTSLIFILYMTVYSFQVYSVMTWYSYTLWNDRNSGFFFERKAKQSFIVDWTQKVVLTWWSHEGYRQPVRLSLTSHGLYTRWPQYHQIRTRENERRYCSSLYCDNSINHNCFGSPYPQIVKLPWNPSVLYFSTKILL